MNEDESREAKVFARSIEEQEAFKISDALSQLGVTDLDQEKLRLLKQQLQNPAITRDIEMMNPDDWFNIPVCLVKAFKVILEQFHLQEERVSNLIQFHNEHIKFEGLRQKGLEGYVAKSNSKLSSQIEAKGKSMYERVLQVSRDNQRANTEFQ